MFKNLTYKKKNLMLLIGGILLLFIIYSFTFKKTVDLVTKCADLEEKILRSSNAPGRILWYEQELKRLEELSGTLSADRNAQQNILSIVSTYCLENKVLLKSFPQATYTNAKDFIIETNTFQLEGGFLPIQKLIYDMEQRSRPGKVASVDYFIKKDPRTNKKALNAKVVVQNISKRSQ